MDHHTQEQRSRNMSRIRKFGNESTEMRMVRLFRSFGVPVTTWTIRSPEERRAVSRGADQIVFEGFDPEVA